MQGVSALARYRHEFWDVSQADRAKMLPNAAARPRWINFAAGLWALLFAAPHAWWALGIPAGFPGGEANHRFMMSSPWRYVYDVVVVPLSVMAIVVALALLRPRNRIIPGWILRTAAWIAFAMLTLRGVAGMVVDGSSDLVWWPIFLTGGVLFGGVARTSGVFPSR
jgi:hypothetical protein